MGADVKGLLDSIINNTDSSYPDGNGPVYDKNTVGAYNTKNNFHPQTFDSGKFKEKLSLYVLHDLINAMMHDETTDLNEMIDESIMRHIKTNYGGSCYGYLCNARDRLKSPLLTDVVQEVDDKTDETKKQVEITKDADDLTNINVNEMLKNVTNYEEFRDKLTKAVTDKVVDDVANVITKRNDAPVFDNIDEELEKDAPDKETETGDVTKESVILNLCGDIVVEYAARKQPISTEDGLNMAIVEYCIDKMDYLFKARPTKADMFGRIKIR